MIFSGALWQKRPKCESISSTTSRTKLEQQQIAENASFPFRLSKGSNAIVRAGSVSSCQEERGRDPMRFWKKTSLQTISTRICEQPKWNNRNLRRHQVMLSCYTELKKNATKKAVYGKSYFPCSEKCSVHEKVWHCAQCANEIEHTSHWSVILIFFVSLLKFVKRSFMWHFASITSQVFCIFVQTPTM